MSTSTSGSDAHPIESAPRAENPLRAEKRKKLHELRQAGIDPYPYSYSRSTSLALIRSEFSELLKAGDKRQDVVHQVAGRLMTLRSMGKANFFNLADESGALQIYIKPEELSPEAQKAFSLVDLGDIVGVSGYVFKTQKGELSLYAQEFLILTKSIEPLPEKFHGITDVETKYRHRHLDLMSDETSRSVFAMRARVIREIRKWMEGEGFMEVETPVLQPIYGGAAAEPFVTHHNALDMKLYLKISPELYLKRLIIGGFEKVFEIGKNFRNEGIDRTHNPEFTMMEWYEAYTDYHHQMNRFESIVAHLATTILGKTQIDFQGKQIELAGPWRRLTVLDGVKQYSGLSRFEREDLLSVCRRHNSKMAGAEGEKASWGELLMEVFELTAEEHLQQPTFVMNHPVEISPLTKVLRGDSRFVERFEPFIAGMEIGNSYSELNDPEEQTRRLKQQQEARTHDKDAHPMDADFLLALEAGMPPTGGVGIGIERLVMLLTNQASIRDILLFPTMKIQRET